MDSDGSPSDCPLDPSEMAGSDESLSEKQWECKVLLKLGKLYQCIYSQDVILHLDKQILGS
jgi:hypothetical protein